MHASSSSVNPTPLAHADTQRDVHPRGDITYSVKALATSVYAASVLIKTESGTKRGTWPVPDSFHYPPPVDPPFHRLATGSCKKR
ncbi:hypothetical protein TNCV_5059261 [Trichonephila clavipes]|nr:hypothetical protein TNCV_5059261 [Trichonephila clavipes]